MFALCQALHRLVVGVGRCRTGSAVMEANTWGTQEGFTEPAIPAQRPGGWGAQGGKLEGWAGKRKECSRMDKG